METTDNITNIGRVKDEPEPAATGPVFVDRRDEIIVLLDAAWELALEELFSERRAA